MIGDLFGALRKKNEEIRNRVWNIGLKDTLIWLCQPAILFQEDIKMERWGQLQSEILNDSLTEVVPHNSSFHVYIRYRPLDLTVSTEFLQGICARYEILHNSEGDKLLVLPDCNEPDLWTALLATDETSPMSKFLCAFDHQLSDCESVLGKGYSTFNESLGEPAYESFASELRGNPYWIGYTVDNDLILEIQLSQRKVFLGVVSKLAKEYRLNITYHNLEK